MACNLCHEGVIEKKDVLSKRGYISYGVFGASVHSRLLESAVFV